MVRTISRATNRVPLAWCSFVSFSVSSLVYIPSRLGGARPSFDEVALGAVFVLQLFWKKAAERMLNGWASLSARFGLPWGWVDVLPLPWGRSGPWHSYPCHGFAALFHAKGQGVEGRRFLRLAYFACSSMRLARAGSLVRRSWFAYFCRFFRKKLQSGSLPLFYLSRFFRGKRWQSGRSSIFAAFFEKSCKMVGRLHRVGPCVALPCCKFSCGRFVSCRWCWACSPFCSFFRKKSQIGGDCPDRPVNVDPSRVVVFG